MNKKVMVRKSKLKVSDFSRVFPSRKLGFKERYMQTFWLIEFDSHYEIHQKLSTLGKIIVPIIGIMCLIPVFFYSGVKGVLEYYSDTTPYFMGKTIRRDQLYHGHESTVQLIKAVGW